MAWMALLPMAFSVVKSALDQSNATSQDAAQQQAGAAKLAAMRQGAQQMDAYRQGLPSQEMQAMKNEMGQYGGAQNVLAQMYGGTPQMGHAIPAGSPPPGTGTLSSMAGRSLYGAAPTPGPAINPGTPGGARAGVNPYFGDTQVSRMGFGGEMPLPADLARRTR